MSKLVVMTGLFFLTAMLYASVGFGGGSSYSALLMISGTDFMLVPVLALACNIAVVSGNVWRYGKARLLNLSKIWPLLVVSIPAAWVGGRLEISETLFVGMLWIALFLAGTRLLLSRPVPDDVTVKPVNAAATAAIGGGIGFYAGLVGIGGGIFLAPILHFIKWDNARQIAATCSLFILVNSLAGILGHIQKLNHLSRLGDAVSYWPLLLAVIAGGFIGNHMGVFRLSETALKRATGVLILIVAVRLAIRWAGLIS